MTSTTSTTTMNKYYLALLAQHLYKLPENYEHFDMRTLNDCTKNPGGDHKLTKPSCGSVACAVGHAPYVKGLPNHTLYWSISLYTYYCFKVFFIPLTLSEYLFSGYWESFDNTPLGAAQRITLALTVDQEKHEFICPWDFNRGGNEARMNQVRMFSLEYQHFKLEDLQPYLDLGPGPITTEL